VRPRVVIVTCVAALVGVVVLTVPTTRAALASLGARSKAVAAFSDAPPSPPPPTAQIAAQPPPPVPTLRAPADPGSIHPAGNPSFFGWAFLDRKTGAIVGSGNSGSGTNTTESMIKAWIASDYLRMQAAAGKTPSDGTLGELTLMIIDSNDNMAEKYYEMDGTNAVVQRLISMCGLTHTTIYPYYWARTTMTPQDAVKYGNCVANGTAAGPKWTNWILDTMRHVRGGVQDQISVAKQGGRWGIIDGLPPQIAAGTSIKNGFTGYVDGWHVNCLAIQQDWVLNVMVRISTLQAAANVCKSVAQQLVVTPEL
jgi:hypothetical protein